MYISKRWIEQNEHNETDFFSHFFDDYLADADKANDYHAIYQSLDTLQKYLVEYSEPFYRRIPKGFLFYWLGFSLYQMNEFDRAVFYIDAALSEDKHYMKKYELSNENKLEPQWMHSGAAAFMLLSPLRPVFSRFEACSLKEAVQNEIANCNNLTSLNYSYINHFIPRFAKKQIFSCKSVLIPALHAFVMEKSMIKYMAKTRSAFGGTSQPFLNHLQKGAIIFESLIKSSYRKFTTRKGTVKTCKTIGEVYSNPDFRAAMGVAYTWQPKTSIDDILGINVMTSGYSIESCFEICGQIRNTVSHSLIWDSGFVQSYEKLYEYIMCSFFYFISKQY